MPCLAQLCTTRTASNNLKTLPSSFNIAMPSFRPITGLFTKRRRLGSISSCLSGKAGTCVRVLEEAGEVRKVLTGTCLLAVTDSCMQMRRGRSVILVRVLSILMGVQPEKCAVMFILGR